MLRSKLAIFTILILLIFLLIACQQTPEEIVIAPKNFDVEKVVEELNETKVIKPYVAEVSWLDMIEFSQSNLCVEISAEVKVPKVGIFPIASIKSMDIDDSMVKNVIDVLFGNKEVFLPDGVMTRSEIEEQILIEKAKFIDPHSIINVQTTTEMKKVKTQGIDDGIAILENQLLTAIEEHTYEKAKFILNDSNADQDSWSYIGESNLGKTKNASIFMRKQDDNNANSIRFDNNNQGDWVVLKAHEGFNILIDDPKDINNLQGISISYDDALKIAHQTLVDLNVDSFALNAVNSAYLFNIGDGVYYNGDQCYVFRFTRNVNDVPVTYDNVVMTNSDFAQWWLNESISIAINDTGIVTLEWNAPSRIEEIITESTEILDFDIIKEVFLKQIEIQGVWGNELEVIQRKIVVDEITLGLMRVAKRDNPDEQLLIPVWDFYGYEEMTYDSADDTQYIVNDDNTYAYRNYRYSFLTINAIDGSIINRLNGY